MPRHVANIFACPSHVEDVEEVGVRKHDFKQLWHSEDLAGDHRILGTTNVPEDRRKPIAEVAKDSIDVQSRGFQAVV